ncbi:MAG: hypothetical protein WCD79_12545 [Chthoniobacteraceae bacterium]
MKIATLLFLCCVAFVRMHAADEPRMSSPDTFATTKTWTLSTPVYAQMKVVPSRADVAPTGLIAVQDWNGLWATYGKFRVTFGCSEGYQSRPKHFRFVDPQIGIDGWGDTSSESHGATVRLFDTASTKDDIKVKMDDVPQHPETGREYKVATVSGKAGIVTWDVYVRFVTQKPDYIKARTVAN